MAKYIVKSGVVKVSIGASSGHRVAHIARQGDMLPEGADETQVKRLLERGRIEVLAEPEGAPEGEPSEKWTKDQLEAYAAEKQVDISSAKNKADIVAAIEAAAKSE